MCSTIVEAGFVGSWGASVGDEVAGQRQALRCRRARRAVVCAERGAPRGPGVEGLPVRLREGFKYGRIRLERLITAPGSSDKPLLVYIPGLDGTGLGVLRQVDRLVDHYDVASVLVPRADRSDWQTMADRVAKLIERECASGRRATVVAESMGAVLTVVMLQAGKTRLPFIDNVVLINPATSYSQTPEINSFWPSTTQLPEALYNLVPLFALPLMIDPIRAVQKPRQALDSARRVMQLPEILPKETFAWRLELLRTSGPFVSDDKLRGIEFPLTVVASVNDALVPSYRESQRILRLVPGATRFVVNGGGHSLLQTPELFNLAEVLARTRTLPQTQTQTVSEHDIEQVLSSRNINDVSSPMRRIAALKRLVSPVFLGMDRVPADRPVIFVGNHTLFGIADIPLLVSHILHSRGLLIRGLAHPWLFQGRENDDEEVASRLELIGAVKVSPRNMYNLLRDGESVLLFPGGAREAYKRKGEQYKLFWPERAEFIRMALKFNAVIVPVASVGVEDAFEVLADGPEILDLPWVGAQVRARMEQIAENQAANARAWKGSPQASAIEDLVSPVARPKALSRQYFGFGHPIDVAASWDEYQQEQQVVVQDDGQPCDERDFCAMLYQKTKDDLEALIEDVASTRETDPFQNAAKRIAFESLMQCQAPTAWHWQSAQSHFFPD